MDNSNNIRQISIRSDGSAEILFKDQTFTTVEAKYVSAPHADPFSGIRADIQSVAENLDVTLTDEEMMSLISCMSVYDYSDYNEYIADVIREIKGDGY